MTDYDAVWRAAYPLLFHSASCATGSEDGGECDCGVRQRIEKAAVRYERVTGQPWSDAPTAIRHSWLKAEAGKP